MRNDTFTTDDDTRALIADLKRELGVTGTAAVFRKALANAREASAVARVKAGAKEPGQVAYEARFAHKPTREVEAWASLTPEAQAIWDRVEQAVRTPQRGSENAP